MSENRSCVIKKEYAIGGCQSEEEEGPNTQKTTIESMIRFEEATQ